MREHDLVQQCNPEPEGKVMNTVQLLCRYRYDPLDRLINILPATQDATARFYNRSRLTTEIQGQIKRSVFQHADLLLAQRQQQGQSSDTTLLVTDSQRSVLRAAAIGQCSSMAYSPYGHRPVETGQLSLLGFNGEQPDPLTGHYLLGNGYRAFNPVLMRFNSPDSLSPFGAGGVNAYAYALGDPVNRVDPTGHFGVFFGVLSSIAAAVAGAAASVKLIMSGYLYLGYGLAAGTAVGTGALVGTVAGSAPRQLAKLKSRMFVLCFPVTGRLLLENDPLRRVSLVWLFTVMGMGRSWLGILHSIWRRQYGGDFITLIRDSARCGS